MPEDGIVIDRSRNTIRISRTYAASVDRAWWAWTDAEAIAQWWGPAGWAATVYEMDVRPGGRWRFEIAAADGSAEPVRGLATYGLVVPHVELAYEDTFADEAWQPDGTGTFPTSVTFASAGTGCRVEVEASFPDLHALRQAVELQMAEGYAEALGRLDDLLRTPQGDKIMQTITSTDGTTIAYEKTGSGPAIIVISNVAEDHTGVAGLAKTLSEHFTVISFDRRGRGASGDPQPYDPARELDDIAALIDIAGGSAALTSGSGGCAITLDAASALGDSVTGLYLYEPPFIVDDSRPPAPTDYIEHVEELVAADRRSEAVEYVMTEMIGVPAEYIEPMKQDPSWNEMARYAHTYAYEGRILHGLMDGTPLPADRWSINAPIAVAVGGNSESYFRVSANALAALLPNVTVLTLPDQDHGAFWAAPEPITEQIREFLLS
ncbi:alpha/beta fold hydrolase [Conexibacter woesei]|uniref:Activator of Hsp90 ATPase 1 family protein n=1 Tax=Conexibacter woesei (strain DSM 14684 / CCUG 47730 / CIP 108061 / JCM 11494 / NBRC 100937 / ID131577) TaxID=469383 RepID=D3FDH3_CONWI|nr:alpha/beta fold hydrolase [Conexibacter woesei]ADB49547.1 Activator of Hsp90 ATPase 1 family protein [Conexibacter woesei DSM 14684]